MPPAARAFALAFLLAASARAAQPQDDRDALLDAVADPAARQLLTLAIGEIAGLKLALASLQRIEQQPQDDGVTKPLALPAEAVSASPPGCGGAQPTARCTQMPPAAQRWWRWWWRETGRRCRAAA